MNISDLKPGMSSVEIKAKVAKLGEPREVQTKYGPNSVADATLKDDTGTITLTLWGAQISTVKENDNIEITGAFVKEWNGDLQISVGRGVILGDGLKVYEQTEYPMLFDGNIYYNGAEPHLLEPNFIEQEEFDPKIKITKIYLK